MIMSTTTVTVLFLGGMIGIGSIIGWAVGTTLAGLAALAGLGYGVNQLVKHITGNTFGGFKNERFEVDESAGGYRHGDEH